MGTKLVWGILMVFYIVVVLVILKAGAAIQTIATELPALKVSVWIVSLVAFLVVFGGAFALTININVAAFSMAYSGSMGEAGIPMPPEENPKQVARNLWGLTMVGKRRGVKEMLKHYTVARNEAPAKLGEVMPRARIWRSAVRGFP